MGALLSGATLLLGYGLGSWRWSPLLQFGAAMPVWLWVGWRFHRGALRAAWHGSANMDTLVSLGSSVAFVYSAIALFLLPGKETFFDVAALIVTLISVGKLLEVVARGRAGEAIEALAGLQPRSAHLLARAARPDDWAQATPVDSRRIGFALATPFSSAQENGYPLTASSSMARALLTSRCSPARACR